MSSVSPRYPDPASPYFIESRGGIHEVRHQYFGLLLNCDCLAEARNQISDREDEDAAADAYEERLIDEAANKLDEAEAAGDLTHELFAIFPAGREAA